MRVGRQFLNFSIMDPKIIFQEEPRGPSVLVEVRVAANGESRIPFPDTNQLKTTPDRVIVVKMMRLITNDVAVGGVLKSGVNAPTSELQKMFLTIYCDGWEKATSIPVLTLNDTGLMAGLIPMRNRQTNFDDWKGISWDKTYLQFANGQVSANAPYVVLFDVQYVKLDVKGQIIEGPK